MLYFVGRYNSVGGFYSYVPGATPVLVTSRVVGMFESSPYFYVNENGKLRCDFFYANSETGLRTECDVYELNAGKTAFSLIESKSLTTPEYYSFIAYRFPEQEAFATTNGYAYLDYKYSAGEDMRVVTPQGAAQLLSVPNTQVFSIQAGSFDPFNDFWVEEDDCVESAYVY